MEGILDIFTQKGIIDYLKERTYPTYMGTELFPEEKRDELKFDELSEGSDIPVIASGGCGSIQDIVDVFEKTNVDAALVASLFHFNEATVEDVRNECKKHGINVRRTR